MFKIPPTAIQQVGCVFVKIILFYSKQPFYLLSLRIFILSLAYKAQKSDDGHLA